jgi:hypothetical protein
LKGFNGVLRVFEVFLSGKMGVLRDFGVKNGDFEWENGGFG